jgi:ribosome maturation factor RimP
MSTVDLQRIGELCERGLSAVGYELVDVEFLRDQSGWVLRVFIDHPPGDEGARAITHEDCGQASQQLSTLLDVEDPIATAYRLEVSSPGVRRRVRKQRDFERFVGRVVRVEMLAPVEGRRNFSGRLVGVVDGVITVDVGERAFALPIAGLRRAHLEEEPQTRRAAGSATPRAREG